MLSIECDAWLTFFSVADASRRTREMVCISTIPASFGVMSGVERCRTFQSPRRCGNVGPCCFECASMWHRSSSSSFGSAAAVQLLSVALSRSLRRLHSLPMTVVRGVSIFCVPDVRADLLYEIPLVFRQCLLDVIGLISAMLPVHVTQPTAISAGRRLIPYAVSPTPGMRPAVNFTPKCISCSFFLTSRNLMNFVIQSSSCTASRTPLLHRSSSTPMSMMAASDCVYADMKCLKKIKKSLRCVDFFLLLSLPSSLHVNSSLLIFATIAFSLLCTYVLQSRSGIDVEILFARRKVDYSY
jgi:hypothetical protein